MTIYRGYDIKPHANGGFYWTDERNFDHTGNHADSATHIDSRVCKFTEEQAMDDIDRHKRAIREALEKVSDPTENLTFDQMHNAKE